MPPLPPTSLWTAGAATVVRSVDEISDLSVLDSVALFLPTMVAASIALLRRTVPTVRRHRYSRHHVVSLFVFIWLLTITLLAVLLDSSIDSARVILLLPINLINYGVLGTLDVLLLLLPFLLNLRRFLRSSSSSAVPDSLDKREHVPFGHTLSGMNMPGLPQWNMMYTSSKAMRVPLAVLFTVIVVAANVAFAGLMVRRKEFVPLVGLLVGLALTMTNTHPSFDRTMENVEQKKDQNAAIRDSPDGAIMHNITSGELTRAFLLSFREARPPRPLPCTNGCFPFLEKWKKKTSSTNNTQRRPRRGTKETGASSSSTSATTSSSSKAPTTINRSQPSQQQQQQREEETEDTASTVRLLMFENASSKLSHVMQWDRRTDETEVERFNRLFPVSSHSNALADDGAGLDTTARSLTAFLKRRYGGAEWADGHMDEVIRKHVLSGDALRAVAVATAGRKRIGRRRAARWTSSGNSGGDADGGVREDNGNGNQNESNNIINENDDNGDELTWLTKTDEHGRIDLYALFVLMHVHAMVEQRITAVLNWREGARANNTTGSVDIETEQLMSATTAATASDDDDNDALPYFIAAMEPKYYGSNRRTHTWQSDYQGAPRDWKLSNSRIQTPDCRRELAVVGTTPEHFFKCTTPQETQHMIAVYERMGNVADSTWVRLYASCLYLIRQKRVAAARLPWKGGDTQHLLKRVEDPISMNGQLESLLVTQLAYSAVIAVKAWLPGRGEL